MKHQPESSPRALQRIAQPRTHAHTRAQVYSGWTGPVYPNCSANATQPWFADSKATPGRDAPRRACMLALHAHSRCMHAHRTRDAAACTQRHACKHARAHKRAHRRARAQRHACAHAGARARTHTHACAMDGPIYEWMHTRT